MSLTIELSAPGGIENLSATRRDPGEPGPGEIRLRQLGAGVNFIDIYQRTGLYPLPMPAILGVEGAGVIEALGPDVEGLAVGERVAYAGIPGGYAEVRLLPAWRAIPLPDALPTEIAASSLLRAFTAHMLLQRVYPVKHGTTILVHAGAGGLASLVIPWARQLGARVISTASSEEKADLSRRYGAERVIVGRNADIAQTVRDWTDGKGAEFTIDGIGGPTLEASLNATAKFGMIASVGQAGGPAGPITLDSLGPLRSLALARPSVMAYLADPATYKAAAPDVLRALQRPSAVAPGPRFPLTEAAAAQHALETGATSGVPLLVI
ncbi:MAG: quinone oxidoreductase [Paenirhodobacter sp.]|uniref:quinone oxidoreductase family protein n=1 Tax=Paenirhodobacter sp. TaxID=1965326 RepID=UPI003D114EC6